MEIVVRICHPNPLSNFLASKVLDTKFRESFLAQLTLLLLVSLVSQHAQEILVLSGEGEGQNIAGVVGEVLSRVLVSDFSDMWPIYFLLSPCLLVLTNLAPLPDW